MASATDIQQLEKQVTSLSDALAHLATPNDWKKLIIILHRPGWTTPAELVFASAILNSLQAHTKALADLKSQLMKGSEAVVAK
ncbi:MAG: hypothetical protein ABSE70_02100 [Candidatus Limnocylindrales bacterium]